jgi:hypothetical protein
MDVGDQLVVVRAYFEELALQLGDGRRVVDDDDGVRMVRDSDDGVVIVEAFMPAAKPLAAGLS